MQEHTTAVPNPTLVGIYLEKLWYPEMSFSYPDETRVDNKPPVFHLTFCLANICSQRKTNGGFVGLKKKGREKQGYQAVENTPRVFRLI